MASYADLADIDELIAQFTINESSTPNTQQASKIIDDTAEEINARLSSAGVSTPVTAPASFLRALALLNAYGAAAAILRSMFPNAAGPGDTPAYAFWEKRYQDGLLAIANGSMIPVDATDNSNVVMPATYLTRNPDSEEDIGTIAAPMFSIGRVF